MIRIRFCGPGELIHEHFRAAQYRYMYMCMYMYMYMEKWIEGNVHVFENVSVYVYVSVSESENVMCVELVVSDRWWRFQTILKCK